MPHNEEINLPSLPTYFYLRHDDKIIKLNTQTSDFKFGKLAFTDPSSLAISIGIEPTNSTKKPSYWFFLCETSQLKSFNGEVIWFNKPLNFFEDEKFSIFFCKTLKLTYLKIKEYSKPSFLDYLKKSQSRKESNISSETDKKAIRDILSHLIKTIQNNSSAYTHYSYCLNNIETEREFNETDNHSNYANSQFTNAADYYAHAL